MKPIPEALRPYVEGWHVVALFPNGAMSQCPVTFDTQKEAETVAMILGPLAPAGVRYAVTSMVHAEDAPEIDVYTRIDFHALRVDGKFYVRLGGYGSNPDICDEYILPTAYRTETEAKRAMEEIAEDMKRKGMGVDRIVFYPHSDEEAQ